MVQIQPSICWCNRLARGTLFIKCQFREISSMRFMSVFSFSLSAFCCFFNSFFFYLNILHSCCPRWHTLVLFSTTGSIYGVGVCFWQPLSNIVKRDVISPQLGSAWSVHFKEADSIWIKNCHEWTSIIWELQGVCSSLQQNSLNHVTRCNNFPFLPMIELQKKNLSSVWCLAFLLLCTVNTPWIIVSLLATYLHSVPCVIYLCSVGDGRWFFYELFNVVCYLSHVRNKSSQNAFNV